MASLADRWHSAILKNSLDLMRYDAHQRTEIIAMINQLGRDLVADLSGAGLNTPRTDWQRARLRELLKAAEDRIGGTYEDIATAHADGLAGAAEASATGLTLALNDAVGFELLQAIKWTPEQLATLVDGSMIVGAPSSAWWARQSVDLQNAFADQMQQGMLRGEVLGDLTGRVKDLLGVSTRNAEGLVRTSAMSVNNSAHMALYQANADVIAELSWAATLDLRTCFECAKHDGEQWPLNTPHAVPPIHFNDRCVTVPITKTWEQLANKNKDLARELDNMPPGLRSSMGGPVSANTTWEDWFKGLKPEQQSEYLGPARQKLWDAGKLSLSDLTDQRGNALTLDQLTAKGQPNSQISPLASRLGKIEKEFTGYKIEHGAIVSPSGEVLMSKAGTADNVPISKEEAKLLKNNIFTHNHPEGQSLSPADILAAVQSNAAEVRAATESGTYFVRRPSGGWGFTANELRRDLEPAFESIVQDMLGRGVKGNDLYHQAWTKLFKLLNIDLGYGVDLV